ncbi:hypothetical protein D1872_217380 [compost metagenome]
MPQYNAYIRNNSEEYKQYAYDPEQQLRYSVITLSHIQSYIFQKHTPEHKGKCKSEHTACRRNRRVFDKINLFNVRDTKPDCFHYTDFTVIVFDLR